MRSRSTVALIAGLIVLVLMNLNEVFTRDRSKDISKERTLEQEELIQRERSVVVDRSARRETAVTTAYGERMIDRTFEVSDGENLAVQVSHVDVNIETGASREARIEVFLDGRDMELARAYFEDLRLSVEKNGNTIEIETNRRQNMRSPNRSGGAQILVKAYIPEHFNVDLATSHGDINIEALTGRLGIRASHGDIDASSIHGPLIEVLASHGDFEAESLEAEDISIRASHGDIDVRGVSASDFNVQASHGDITVNGISGNTEASNSHGDIDIGFLRLGDISLRNSHGDISIFTPADAQAYLEFSASGIRLSSDIHFEGTKKQERVSGEMNGGGSILEARTTHGSIHLRTN